MTDAGALPLLVGMLGSPHREIQANAAGCLSALSRDNVENQTTIARTGAIAPLCTLVREGSPETKEYSASALWALTHENAPNKATIAKLGGIEPLVGLLVSGGTAKSSRNAAGALASLSAKHSDNRTAIAKRLVGLLSSKDPKRACRVLSALVGLCDNSANQIAIAKAGGIPPLISWLNTMSEAAQIEGANALLAIAADNVTTQALIVKFNGIPPLITLIAKSKADKAKEHAARTLWHLASSEENQRAIACEASGLYPLVSMLSASGQRACELAAVTLVRLVTGNEAVSERLAEVGGVGPLVRLLTNESSYAQQQAVAAIAELALLPANRDTIAICGGLQPLVRLLTCPTKGTAELAARAIGHLSRNQKDGGGDHGGGGGNKGAAGSETPKRPGGSTHGTAIESNVDATDGDGNAEDTSEDQGMRALLSPVYSDDDDDSSSSDDSEELDGLGLGSGDGKEGGKDGGAARAVSPSSGGEREIDVRKRVHEVKVRRARFDGVSRRSSIHTSGGVRRLIAMLEGRTPGSIYAPFRFGQGGSYGSTMDTSVHGEEAVGDSAAKKLWAKGVTAASDALHDAMHGSINDETAEMIAATASDTELPQLDTSEIDMAEEAAMALRDMASHDSDMQDAIIELGGVPHLLALFHSPIERAQEHAARCVMYLCASVDNQAALVAEGTIAEFVLLLRNGNSTQQEVSAAGLADLARGGVFERMQLQREIEARQLEAAALASEADEGSQTDGVRATAEVGLEQMQRRSSRSPSPVPSRRNSLASAGAGNETDEVGKAMSSAEDAEEEEEDEDGKKKADEEFIPDNCRLRAILDEGAIVPLIFQLSTGSVIGREKAACALWHLALDISNQGAIARANGIPPLVSLLDFADGTAATFRHAANTLARLAINDEENQAQMSKRLVMLLAADAVVAQVRAARALWNLAADQPNSPVVILNAGALLPLVRMLATGAPEARREASGALSTLAMSSQQNALAIAIGLVTTLGSGEDSASEHVTQLLLSLCQEGTDHRRAIAEASAIQKLVLQLKSKSIKAQELAAAALALLTSDAQRGEENVSECASAGGVRPLVALLDSPSVEAQAYAAAAIADLTRSSRDCQEAVTAANGIEPLIGLLTTGFNAECKAEAAGALCSLSTSGEAQQTAMASLGAIVPLVALLTHKDPRCQAKAAGAVSGMCTSHRVNQDTMTAAGGIVPLVALLTPPSLNEMMTAMDDPLSSSAAPATSSTAAGTSPKASLETMRTLRESVMANAASALAELARAHYANQTAIAGVDALVPLISLVQGEEDEWGDAARREEGSALKGTPLSAPRGASVRGNEGEVSGGQKAVKDGGSDRQPSRPSSPHSSIADDTTGSSQVYVLAKEAAAQALWTLSDCNYANQVSVAAHGGLSPLIALLGSGSAKAERNAAGALGALSRENVENEEEIARMLVELLAGSGAPEKAARAISRLASQSVDSQNAIAAAGGIPLLVDLLCNGVDAMIEAAELEQTITDEEAESNVEEAAVAAASALSSSALLQVCATSADEGGVVSSSASSPASGAQARRASRASKEPSASSGARRATRASRESIESYIRCGRRASWEGSPASQLLQKIALNKGSNKDYSDTISGWMPVLALKEIAGAMWSMAFENESNQKEVTKCGGISPLIAMLSGQGVLHREAAGALWALGADSDNQQEIAGAGGIEPLVALLMIRPSTGAQDASAGALANLAKTSDLRERIAEAGGVSPLVELFNSGSAASTQAALALRTLVLNNEANQFSIAQGLVRVLSSGSAQAQEPVTELIRDLCVNKDTDETASFNENRSAIARAGGIPQLVRQLKAGTGRAQSLAAEALSLIAMRSGELRVQVTQQLVGLLGAESEEVRKRAGVALREMAAEGGDESQKASAMAGGVSPLVSLLKDGLKDERLEAQEYALWSLSLVTDSHSRHTMVSEGTVQCLVRCLVIGKISNLAEEHAATVLACLARDTAVHEEIVESGGIAPLVALLSGTSSTGAKRMAANGLARLALTSSATQAKIADAGAVAPLLVWLSSQDTKSPVSGRPTGLPDLAARALDAVATSNQDTSAQVIRAGAVAPLVAMLAADRSLEAQRSSAGLLATLAEAGEGEGVAASIAAEGGIPALVSLLVASERTTPHENATRALWHLAASGEENQTAIAQAGGIVPLVVLLESGTEATKQYAAAAAESLADGSADNQLALARARAIPPLVELLGSDRPETQQHAVGALLHLASEEKEEKREGEVPKAPAETRAATAVIRRLVGVLDSRNASAQMVAASALATLAPRSATTRTSIRDAGAIPPLVRLLGDGRRTEEDTPPERAATVLADLARSSDSLAEIVESGGVPPLVAMCDSESHKAQTSAACALWHLASIGENREQIVLTGGIARLVSLLEHGCAEARRYGTQCLWHISNSADNKNGIVAAGGIDPIVDVLDSLGAKSPEAQESATALLSELARTNNENKSAIVYAGGIPPLIKALALTSPIGAQKHASAGLWALTQGATGLEFKQMMLTSDIIPPLVLLLSESASPEVQGYAVAILHALCQEHEGRTCLIARHGVEPLKELMHRLNRKPQLPPVGAGSSPAALRSSSVSLSAVEGATTPGGGGGGPETSSGIDTPNGGGANDPTLSGLTHLILPMVRPKSAWLSDECLETLTLVHSHPLLDPRRGGFSAKAPPISHQADGLIRERDAKLMEAAVREASREHRRWVGDDVSESEEEEEEGQDERGGMAARADPQGILHSAGAGDGGAGEAEALDAGEADSLQPNRLPQPSLPTPKTPKSPHTPHAPHMPQRSSGSNVTTAGAAGAASETPQQPPTPAALSSAKRTVSAPVKDMAAIAAREQAAAAAAEKAALADRQQRDARAAAAKAAAAGGGSGSGVQSSRPAAISLSKDAMNASAADKAKSNGAATSADMGGGGSGDGMGGTSGGAASVGKPARRGSSKNVSSGTLDALKAFAAGMPPPAPAPAPPPADDRPPETPTTTHNPQGVGGTPASRKSTGGVMGGEAREAAAAAFAAAAAAAAAKERAEDAAAKGLLVTRCKLKMREGAPLDSAGAGDLPMGATVQVLDRQTVPPDGTQRACVAYAGELVPRGWITAIDRKDRTENLLKPNDSAAMALVAHHDATAHRIPRLALGGSGRDGERANRSPGRDRAGTDSQIFVVRQSLKMRASIELDSAECGFLAPNTQVRIVDRRQLPDGTRRARVGANDEEFQPLGWVSLLGKDGKDNLVVEWRK